MPAMYFDSHRGWVNPNPDRASRPFRADAPLSGSHREPRPRQKTLAEMTTQELLDLAYSRGAGAMDAQKELRRRG